MSRRGPFIVFEGVEGGGKSTQYRLLAQSFQQAGYEVVLTHEPGGTEIGEQVRQILLDPQYDIIPLAETFLFSAARRQHCLDVIEPALAAGSVVICDRFEPSTVVYQGYAGEVQVEEVEAVSGMATEGLVPDLVLVFDLDPEEGFRRKKGDEADRIEQKSLEFHQRIREGFLQYAADHQQFCEVIDAGRQPAEVHLEIIQIVNERFGLELVPVLDV